MKKTNNITFKMTYRPKQIILKRGSPNGCESLKAKFNNLSHQENVNQNYFEISCYSPQNS